MPSFRLHMMKQPDDRTCGPTCLHAAYRYFGDERPLDEVIAEVPSLESGGTLGVLLGTHALRSGYDAVIYTYNLEIFDPSWFGSGAPPLRELLLARLARRHIPRLTEAIPAYVEFLDLGGRIEFEDLRPSLLRRYLERSLPILTGLSSTYLYHAPREDPETDQEDPIGGSPVGHFVVLCGWDPDTDEIEIADPYEANPLSETHSYRVGIERVLGAILLGVLTYDGNLLVIEPKTGSDA